MKIEYPIRLQAYLAKSGCGSRRFCETLITAGRVKINTKRVTELGTKVNRDDVVQLDDETIEPVEKSYYFALHKPKGYVCTNFDPNEKLYARELININDWHLLFHIGRLDKESTGLILYTNDGDVANKIMHPSNEIEKEYLVQADKEVLKTDLLKAIDGIYIDQKKPYKIKSFQLLTRGWVRVVLTEGKNREIRKIFSALGYDVKKLCRIRIGNIELGDLDPGQYKKLTYNQIQDLLNGVNAKSSKSIKFGKGK